MRVKKKEYKKAYPYYGDSYIQSAKYKRYRVSKYHIFVVMLIGSLLLTILLATKI